MKDVFDRDEIQSVLEKDFYRPPAKPPKKAKKPKPDHYDVICISLYRQDLERLDQRVADLKRQGHRKMNRSALIRFALDTMDTDQLPKSY